MNRDLVLACKRERLLLSQTHKRLSPHEEDSDPDGQTKNLSSPYSQHTTHFRSSSNLMMASPMTPQCQVQVQADERAHDDPPANPDLKTFHSLTLSSSSVASSSSSSSASSSPSSPSSSLSSSLASSALEPAGGADVDEHEPVSNSVVSPSQLNKEKEKVVMKSKKKKRRSQLSSTKSRTASSFSTHAAFTSSLSSPSSSSFESRNKSCHICKNMPLVRDLSARCVHCKNSYCSRYRCVPARVYHILKSQEAESEPAFLEFKNKIENPEISRRDTPCPHCVHEVSIELYPHDKQRQTKCERADCRPKNNAYYHQNTPNNNPSNSNNHSPRISNRRERHEHDHHFPDTPVTVNGDDNDYKGAGVWPSFSSSSSSPSPSSLSSSSSSLPRSRVKSSNSLSMSKKKGVKRQRDLGFDKDKTPSSSSNAVRKDHHNTKSIVDSTKKKKKKQKRSIQPLVPLVQSVFSSDLDSDTASSIPALESDMLLSLSASSSSYSSSASDSPCSTPPGPPPRLIQSITPKQPLFHHRRGVDTDDAHFTKRSNKGKSIKGSHSHSHSKPRSREHRDGVLPTQFASERYAHQEEYDDDKHHSSDLDQGYQEMTSDNHPHMRGVESAAPPVCIPEAVEASPSCYAPEYYPPRQHYKPRSSYSHVHPQHYQYDGNMNGVNIATNTFSQSSSSPSSCSPSPSRTPLDMCRQSPTSSSPGSSSLPLCSLRIIDVLSSQQPSSQSYRRAQTPSTTPVHQYAPSTYPSSSSMSYPHVPRYASSSSVYYPQIGQPPYTSSVYSANCIQTPTVADSYYYNHNNMNMTIMKPSPPPPPPSSFVYPSYPCNYGSSTSALASSSSVFMPSCTRPYNLVN